MTPVKDLQSSGQLVNTSERIQQIFAEVQSQLPTVNFDNDDQNDDNDNEEIFDSNIHENTDALIESLINNKDNSFLTIHQKIETPQQPPSVELQMRSSPNLFDNSTLNQELSSKPPILSMDLFNTIDFDKLSSITNSNELPQCTNLTPTFHRQPPNNSRNSSTQPINIKNRDERQILERLTQQANRFMINQRSHSTRQNPLFRNLESVLYATTHEHIDRHGRRTGIPESRRKTIYIDLRNSNDGKQEKKSNEQELIEKNVESSQSESDDDDDHNDGMLWFEKRQQARREQQLNSTKK